MKSQITWLLAGLVLTLGHDTTQKMRAECDSTSKYVVPNFKSNWYKAMEYCHYLGMKLVTVANGDEQMAIVGSIEDTDKANGTSFWTGGNDLGDSGNYHWYSTGTRIMWFNWNTSDRYGRNGNCIYLATRRDGQADLDSNEWMWFTSSCSEAKYFVCERV
nr:C-type lectin 37Da-like [Aedes albopictus]